MTGFACMPYLLFFCNCPSFVSIIVLTDLSVLQQNKHWATHTHVLIGLSDVHLSSQSFVVCWGPVRLWSAVDMSWTRPPLFSLCGFHSDRHLGSRPAFLSPHPRRRGGQWEHTSAVVAFLPPPAACSLELLGSTSRLGGVLGFCLTAHIGEDTSCSRFPRAGWCLRKTLWFSETIMWCREATVSFIIQLLLFQEGIWWVLSRWTKNVRKKK